MINKKNALQIHVYTLYIDTVRWPESMLHAAMCF